LLQERVRAEPLAAVVPELKGTPQCDSTGSESSEELLEEEHDALAGKAAYNLNKSAWDMTFFIGAAHFGRSKSTLMILGALVNLLLQASFCFILMDKHWTSAASLEERVKGADTWRLHFGHLFDSRDPLSGTSLVARVCAGSHSLPSSEVKADLGGTASSYHKNNGPLLTVMVCVVYGMLVCVELRSVIDFTVAIWGVPDGDRTHVSVIDDEAKLETVSPTRRWAGTLLALVRAAVAVVLCTSGLKWLVKTVDIETLLLNCVALGFILEIDEFVYASFSPTMLDNLISNIKPLPFRDSHIPRKKIRAGVTIALAIGIAMVLAVDLSRVRGTVEDLLTVLCGGDQNFVYATSPMGVVHAASTPRYGVRPVSQLLRNISKAREETVRALINCGNADLAKEEETKECPRIFNVKWVQAEELKEFESRRIADLAQERESCEDQSESLHTSGFGAILDRSVHNCEGAVDLCDQEVTSPIRLLCPKTCGCDSPLSGLAFTNLLHGCPKACRKKSKHILNEKPCKDMTAQELSQTGWTRWLRNRLVQPEGIQDTWPDEDLAAVDCGGVMNFIANNSRKRLEKDELESYFCSMRSLAAFCPVLCGCSDKAKLWTYAKASLQSPICSSQCVPK